MKIVVIGGSGLIGGKLVTLLRDKGHEVIAASPKSGVDTLTGAGLAEALADARAVVDVSNSPSFADEAAMAFFVTSTRNLLAAGAGAGIAHLVALSVVGTERLQQSGYFRAKLAQEELIAASALPHTIVRSTQFFEFLDRIAGGGAGEDLRLAPAPMQPILSDDVAVALADVVLAVPAGGMVEIAGPDSGRLTDFARQVLAARGHPRRVVDDPREPYFGATLDDRSLMPGPAARLGAHRFGDWLSQLA